MDLSKHLVPSFMLSICAIFLAASARAQYKAGIQGTIQDKSGAAVSAAKVTLVNQATGIHHEAVSGDTGFYRFTELPPSTYTLTVEVAGFKKKEIQNLIANADQVRGVDVTLEVGEVSASVTVNGDTLTNLQSEDASISGTINNKQIDNLPAFGRDPYQLLRLAPGVFGDDARAANGNSQNLPLQQGPGGSNSQIFQIENQVQIVADGQRVSANNYMIDGVSANSLGWGGAAVITPNAESVNEIQVLSSTYSAEDGRNSGAQVKVTSKSGTNTYHGSGFFKLDSPGLNAFNKYSGPFGHPNQNNSGFGRVNNLFRQFGGSIGGPVIHDKLFFFFSYEGVRQNNPTIHTR